MFLVYKHQISGSWFWRAMPHPTAFAEAQASLRSIRILLAARSAPRLNCGSMEPQNGNGQSGRRRDTFTESVWHREEGSRGASRGPASSSVAHLSGTVAHIALAPASFGVRTRTCRSLLWKAKGGVALLF